MVSLSNSIFLNYCRGHPDQLGSFFASRVSDSGSYLVLEFDINVSPSIVIEKKPALFRTRSSFCLLQFREESVLDTTRQVRFAARVELEITSIDQVYLLEQKHCDAD